MHVVKTTETDPNPSHVIRQALMQQGYRLLGRFYRDSQPEEVCQITYYVKGEVVLLLETICASDTREEIGCELYRAVSPSPSLAETIAAIP